ncbi:MAG: N-6 DNA methylase [Roseburia sp.]|nr:N-6 DNA methylase [Roseburia sp.]
MCKYEREGRMPIIFDDDSQMFYNTGFIDELASLLRVGGYVPDRYKNVIIPMMIITRLDYVLKDGKEELLDVIKGFEDAGQWTTMNQAEKDEFIITYIGKPFYNISEFITLEEVMSEPQFIKNHFLDYIKGFSKNIKNILNSFKFLDEVNELNKKNILFNVIDNFFRKKEVFDPHNADDLAMGNLFEGIIRKYYANPTAGQYFTPREIIKLMVNLLIADRNNNKDLFEPETQVNILDAACGTGGMLSVAESTLKELFPDLKITLYGQEFSDELQAVCVSDMLIKGQDARIEHVNTLTTDAFPEKKMRYIIMNPPFGLQWKPSGGKGKNEDEKKLNALLEKQLEEIQEEAKKLRGGKYEAGIPTDGQDSQLLFIQHALYKLQDNGKIAIITNGKPLFAGDISSGESKIRKWILDKDYLETIIGLPGNMFYNTSINIYIHILSKSKKGTKREGKVQLINAQDNDENGVKMYNFHRVAKKSIGDKRNELTKDHVTRIVDLYTDFDDRSEYCKIIPKEDFLQKQIVTKQAYQCNFILSAERLELFRDRKLFHALVHSGQGGSYEKIKLSIEKREKQLHLEPKEETDIKKYEKGMELFEKIYSVLAEGISDEVYYNIDAFIDVLKVAFGYVKKKKFVLEALDDMTLNDIKESFFNKSFEDFFRIMALDFSKHDDEAEIMRDEDGNIIFNEETKDTEVMPASKNIQEYLDEEVLPFAKNTFMIGDVTDDTEKNFDIVRGAEFSFTKQFYKYQTLEDSSVLISKFQEIEQGLVADIELLLAED